MKRTVSLSFLVSLAFFVVSVVWLRLTFALPFNSPVTTFGGPATFPALVLGVMASLSFIVTAAEFWKMLRETGLKDGMPKEDIIRIVGLLCVMAVYVLVIEAAGYIPATVGLVLASLLLFGQRNKVILASVSVLFPLVIFLLFQQALEVQLP